MPKKIRAVIILLGVFLSSSALWGSVAIAIARKAFHIERAAELLSIGGVVVAVCFLVCFFVLPKKLRKAGVL